MGLNVGEFVFELDQCMESLDDIGAERVMIQVPDGLKRYIDEIKEPFESAGYEVTVWGGTCYGACDIPVSIGDADVLVHFGHSEIPNLQEDYRVIYVEGRCREDRWKDIPEDILDQVKGTVCLYASLQYLPYLDRLREKLEKKGHRVIVGDGDGRIKYPGQVLGCNYSVRREADTHIYVGTGRFHPIGLSLTLNREVWVLNPLSGDVYSTEDLLDKKKRQRYGKIGKGKDCRNIGILVSQKPGQSRKELARELFELCGDVCTLLELDEIEPGVAKNYDFDCLVNTACPRIALDDSINFDVTILTPQEFRMVLKDPEWKEFHMDEIH